MKGHRVDDLKNGLTCIGAFVEDWKAHSGIVWPCGGDYRRAWVGRLGKWVEWGNVGNDGLCRRQPCHVDRGRGVRVGEAKLEAICKLKKMSWFEPRVKIMNRFKQTL